MKNKISNSILISGLLLFTLNVKPETVVGAFREGVWSARSAGMGGAFIGVSDDANAILFNPGGLAQLEKTEACMMYSKLFNGLDGVNLGVNQLTIGVPYSKHGNFGSGWKNFVSAGEYQEDTFYLSYAKWLSGAIAGGVNLKYLGHKYTLDQRSAANPVFAGGVSKYAAAVDIGFMAVLEIKQPDYLGGEVRQVNIGLAAKNLNQPDVGLKTEDRVPAELGLGFSYKGDPDVTSALDVVYRAQEWGEDKNKLSFRAGEERWFLHRLLAARYGLGSSEASAGFSFNPFVWRTNLQIDYAFIWPFEIKDSQGSHHMSLVLRF